MNQIIDKQALHLLLPTDRGIEMIDTKTLVRVEAISNYSKLYFANGKTLVVAKVLKWFEPLLAEKGFLRIHRSHLVNTAWIERVDHTELKMYLRNNSCVHVSRRKHCSVTRYLQLSNAA